MMKWLRKHTKQIMVVVVLFSMFAFVGGSALQWILSPSRSADPYARVFGKEITFLDMYPAQRDTSTLERLYLSWKYDLPNWDMTVRHWYVLAQEAERAGIVIPDEEVEEALQLRVQLLEQQGFPADYLDVLRTQSRITPIEVRRALRQHLAIQKNAARVSDAATPSEAEVRHYVRDTANNVRVRFVTLDAQKFLDPNETFTEEALRAHFEANKDVDAGDSETGFGCRYPRRVKVQYILASISEIEPQVAVTFEEIKDYWKKNKGQYKKTIQVDAPDPTTGPATTQASTRPAEPPKKVSKEVEKSFSEARADVERAIRKKKALQTAEEAMRKAARELLRPWEGQKTDVRTGYKPIPQVAQDPDHMRSISEAMSREFGIPLEYKETPLSSMDTLSKDSTLRSVRLEGGGQESISLTDYAFRVPPFVKRAMAEETGPCLQLFQSPDVPLKGTAYQFAHGQFTQSENLVLFRVVEAREAEAPTSLAEVRGDVERDLRVVRAFERIEPVAKEIFAVASRLGVQDAMTLFEELRTKRGVRDAISPAPFSRRVSLADSKDRAEQARYLEALEAGKPTLAAPNVPSVGASKEFVDACFEMAVEGWQPEEVDSPETEQVQAATTMPAATPTPVVRLLSIPKLRKWFVIELLGTEDVEQDRFESELREAAYNSLRGERRLKLRMDWFKPENIDARCGFEFIAPEEAEEPSGSDEGIDAADQPPFPYL
ncbi:MAG: hypothetical protein JXQ75_23925 [Phycisphaerae bacterium]|nr:hypothetical protein [Phycisphaerae bacterium]